MGTLSVGHELNDKEYENAKCRMLRPPRDHETDEQTGQCPTRLRLADPLSNVSLIQTREC